MKRIAHVVTTYNPGMGVTADTSALAWDQRQQGFEVEFIIGRHADSELIREKRQQGFSVMQINSLRKYAHPWDDFRSLIILTRLFKEKQFDVVHTHLAKAGILGRLAARWAGVKTIIHTVYGATFAPTIPAGKNLLYRGLEKISARSAHRLIFVGQEIRDAYVQAGICPVDKTAVVYYQKDLSPFVKAASLSEKERETRRQALGLSPKTIVLGNVSRIVPWKGHDYALQVLYELKKHYQDIKLVIVGAPKLASEKAYEAKLKAKAKALGVTEDVLFTGWQENTAYYYSIFDIYLITSMPHEGVSISVLEAFASGLPVAGFDCFGVREIMGNKAQLVATKDVARLVEILKQEIACLPETRAQRGKNLNEINKLQKRHSLQHWLAEANKIYHDLMRRQSS